MSWTFSASCRRDMSAPWWLLVANQKPGLDRLGTAGDQFGEQECHPVGDVVTDSADPFGVEVGGVGDVPVEVTTAGDSWAGVTATHGDDDVGAPDNFVGEWLGEQIASGDAYLGESGHDLGLDLVDGLRSG